MVKIFKSNSDVNLQSEINDWLRTNKDKFVLKQIAFSSFPIDCGFVIKIEYSAMLWYTQKTL